MPEKGYALGPSSALLDVWSRRLLRTARRGRHATKHFHQQGHPVIASFEPGERWAWCYVDQAELPVPVRFIPVLAADVDKESLQEETWPSTTGRRSHSPRSMRPRSRPRELRVADEDRAGQTLFRCGDRDAKFFIVKSGQVEIRRDRRCRGSSSFTSAVPRRGSNQLTGRPAVVIALAQTDCEVYPVSPEALRNVLNRCPDLATSSRRSSRGYSLANRRELYRPV